MTEKLHNATTMEIHNDEESYFCSCIISHVDVVHASSVNSHVPMLETTMNSNTADTLYFLNQVYQRVLNISGACVAPSFQVAITKFQDSNHVPGQGFSLQFPSFRIHTKIQVRVSSCNFQVSRFKLRSMSGFQVAISKFPDPHQDPGQGFKL